MSINLFIDKKDKKKCIVFQHKLCQFTCPLQRLNIIQTKFQIHIQLITILGYGANQSILYMRSHLNLKVSRNMHPDACVCVQVLHLNTSKAFLLWGGGGKRYPTWTIHLNFYPPHRNQSNLQLLGIHFFVFFEKRKLFGLLVCKHHKAAFILLFSSMSCWNKIMTV